MAKNKTPAPVLGTFDDQPVLGTGIKITHAGDGLSKALAVAPQIMHHHDKVYVVLETTVENIAFPPIKDMDGVVRMHTLKAGLATIVNESIVRDVLDEQARVIEASSGVIRIDFGDPDDRTDEEIMGV